MSPANVMEPIADDHAGEHRLPKIEPSEPGSNKKPDLPPETSLTLM
jgi:hypothetical protein